MSSGIGLTRSVASLGEATSGVARMPLAAALRMNSGSGTQWWVQRPSDVRKKPLGARGSITQVSKFGVSARSAITQGPSVVASTPCSNEALTCCPRPVTSRARSAAFTPTVAM